MPLSSARTGSATSARSRMRSSVGAVTKICPPTVHPSTRAARVTAAPPTACLARCSEPMLPTTTSAVVTGEPNALGRFKERLGHFRGDIAAEGVADKVPLAQSALHLVEGARELAHLVA